MSTGGNSFRCAWIADGPEENVWGYLMNDRLERFEIIPGGDYLAWVLARRDG